MSIKSLKLYPVEVRFNGSPEPFVSLEELYGVLRIAPDTMGDWARRYPTFPCELLKSRQSTSNQASRIEANTPVLFAFMAVACESETKAVPLRPCLCPAPEMVKFMPLEAETASETLRRD
jgi:hypothetical protein